MYIHTFRIPELLITLRSLYRTFICALLLFPLKLGNIQVWAKTFFPYAFKQFPVYSNERIHIHPRSIRQGRTTDEQLTRGNILQQPRHNHQGAIYPFGQGTLTMEQQSESTYKWQQPMGSQKRAIMDSTKEFG